MDMQGENIAFAITFIFLLGLVWLTGLIVWVWCRRDWAVGTSEKDYSGIRYFSGDKFGSFDHSIPSATFQETSKAKVGANATISYHSTSALRGQGQRLRNVNELIRFNSSTSSEMVMLLLSAILCRISEDEAKKTQAHSGLNRYPRTLPDWDDGTLGSNARQACTRCRQDSLKAMESCVPFNEEKGPEDQVNPIASSIKFKYVDDEDGEEIEEIGGEDKNPGGDFPAAEKIILIHDQLAGGDKKLSSSIWSFGKPALASLKVKTSLTQNRNCSETRSKKDHSIIQIETN